MNEEVPVTGLSHERVAPKAKHVHEVRVQLPDLIPEQHLQPDPQENEMPHVPMTEDEVARKLGFARRRMNDMRSLNAGNFPGAPTPEKHQLAEEFFFHLLGAIELTAQFTNDSCGLGISPDRVSVNAVACRAQPRLQAAISALYVNIRKNPMPPDPYSSQGLLYRAYTYRHHVTHRRTLPFFYRVGSSPEVSFVLDPRDPNPDLSRLSLWDDLEAMLCVVGADCQYALDIALGRA